MPFAVLAWPVSRNNDVSALHNPFQVPQGAEACFFPAGPPELQLVEWEGVRELSFPPVAPAEDTPGMETHIPDPPLCLLSALAASACSLVHVPC